MQSKNFHGDLIKRFDVMLQTERKPTNMRHSSTHERRQNRTHPVQRLLTRLACDVHAILGHKVMLTFSFKYADSEKSILARNYTYLNL